MWTFLMSAMETGKPLVGEGNAALVEQVARLVAGVGALLRMVSIQGADADQGVGQEGAQRLVSLRLGLAQVARRASGLI